MDSSTHPRPRPLAPRGPAAGTEISPTSESARAGRGTRPGIGGSAIFLIVVAVAVAAVLIAGLSFGWSGWLTASLGGISILILLPCLVMCGGLLVAGVMAITGRSSKNSSRDRRP